MFRSTNSGANWTQLTATGGSGTIIEFAIAPSNNQVIYVIHGTTLFKTTDGGATWANVNTGLPGNKTYIAIDPTDANNAWVTVSGYTAGSKVFMTTNGGTSWTNVSSNLPNLPANCIVYEP
ncbi:MAG TPA: glycosyl hydrolase, partial [Bacteroidia bacterium]|nr:glycosyl hydrolase [Bacteroidia bacterium]